MLICPQCQFENPDENKFCQACGASLSEKFCPQCGALVSWNDYECQHCGTVTGTIWRSIIVGDPVPIDSTYLDPEQRYQILDPIPTAAESLVELRVLDRQPLQQPSLETSGIPEIAQPYLALQATFPEVVPPIHHTWKHNHQEIALIKDRSSLPSLVERFRTDHDLSLLQILHWFDGMVDLWEVLERWHLRQSLLEIHNLRVHEDQVLLQRLYPEPSVELTLQNLGTLWQALLAQLPQTQSAALHLLLNQVQMGEILASADLRSRLKTLIDETQLNVSEAEMMSDPQVFPPDHPSSASNPAPSSATEKTPLPPLRAEDATFVPQDDDESADEPTIVLPMQLFSLEDAGCTDIGRQRSHNEDCFGIETQMQTVHLASGKVVRARGVYILCDGMGGHASGEVASQLAVDTLRNYFRQYWQTLEENHLEEKLPPAEVIREAVQLANKAIYDVNQENARSGSGRMGTTMVMVLLHDTEAAVAHVGDSRLYRYTRKRGLEQLTSDHEVGQREIMRGVEPSIAYGRPDAYQLTQALGPRDENFVNPDVQFFELNEDAVLILASDGLTDNDLLEHHWQTHVDPLFSSQICLEAGANKLIDLANQHNGHDNITAIVIHAKVRPKLDQLK